MSRIPCPAENSIEKKVQCVVLTLYTHWQCVSVSIQHFRNWKLIKVIIFVELLWCRMTRATSVGRPTVIRMTKMKRPSLLIWLTLCCCCIGTGMSQRQGKNFGFFKTFTFITERLHFVLHLTFMGCKARRTPPTLDCMMTKASTFLLVSNFITWM